MSYQVIARKYRPQRFQDVVGQEHVTQTLANAIRKGRIAHAYLFCGPRGTGKTTVARIFAKCLNCVSGPSIDYPEEDPRCREITEGRSLDVLEIDGASNRGIDEIRDLRDSVRYAPANSRFKVYIIDEVHMLTKEAFNALLKTLEEPPPHVKFMFATTEPEKVLPTILSRCQRFDLRRIPASLIVNHLAQIASQEGVKVHPNALHAIARGADGGMRDAESTLDQLISFCGTTVEEADVLSMFGLAAQSQILALARAVIHADAAAALHGIHDLCQNGKELPRLVSDLLGHFRNILVCQSTGDAAGLLELNDAEAAAIKEHATALPAASTARILDVLTHAESALRNATSKRIFVEVAMVRAIEARTAVPIDTLLAALQHLRESGAAAIASPSPSVSPTPAAKHSNPSIPASAPRGAETASLSRTSAADSAATHLSSDLAALWVDLVDALGRASPFNKTYFAEAHPVGFEGRTLTIGFDPEFADHLGLVDNPRVHALIETKLRELGHANAKAKFVQAEMPPGWLAKPATPAGGSAPAAPPANPPVTPPPTAAPAPASAQPAKAVKKTGTPAPLANPAAPMVLNKEEFRNDPLIKHALEVFRGHIVEVRGQS